MSVVRTSSLSVDLGNAEAIVVRSSAVSYIPRIVQLPILTFAIFITTYTIGAIFSGLDDQAPLWAKALQISMGLFLLMFVAVVSYSSIRIIASDNVDLDALVTIKWAIGITAALLILGAGLEFSGYITIQETGGNFGDNYKAKEDTMNRILHEAGVYVLMAAGLLLSYLSLRFIGRQDVLIVRTNGIQRLRNISSEDALTLKDSL